MKSQKIINREGKFTAIIDWFTMLLLILFLMCIGSIMGMSFISEYEAAILTLFEPEFLVTISILALTIIGFFYCRPKKDKTQKSKAAIVSLNLSLLFLTGYFVLNDFFYRQIPTIDIFKWGSVIILCSNILLSFFNLNLRVNTHKIN